MCGALFLAQFRLLRFLAVSLATKLIHPPGKLVGVSQLSPIICAKPSMAFSAKLTMQLVSTRFTANFSM